MFDVSFSELMVIAVIALIVIGPEKLPKVARTLGALTGRMQRYVAQVKEEVNREVRFEELQQLQQEIQETVTKTEATLQRKADGLTRELDFQDVNDQEANFQEVSNESKQVTKEVTSEFNLDDGQPAVKPPQSKNT
ncbi:MAG TPA: Sec-independent protein translocase protein TatB [Methylotenera sp.]|nr:Sec-independent protein translocase protein TatB [Methylotenera sp.]